VGPDGAVLNPNPGGGTLTSGCACRAAPNGRGELPFGLALLGLALAALRLRRR